jgi:hypothetical protein
MLYWVWCVPRYIYGRAMTAAHPIWSESSREIPHMTTGAGAGKAEDIMETNMVTGVESGMRTILVLTGVTSHKEIERFAYRPTWVVDSITEIENQPCT